MRRGTALLFLAALRAVAADLSPETLLLAKARARMSTNLSRLPDYTCVQTIERFGRDSSKGRPHLVDVVRLEVALVGGNELFSWPGSGKFLDTEISKLVVGGAIGNGNFALHAKSVFQSSSPRFTYVGEQVYKTRKVLRWDYVVAQNQSGYRIRVNTREAIVGYHGSILVDSESLDLVRLEVHADDIPPRLELLSSRDAVEYARVPIGTETFLLPSLSELEMVALRGSMNHNRTRFSKCRQYTGESTLIFDEPEPSATAAEAPVREVEAPPGVRFEAALAATVVFTNAAVGDPVTAVLVSPLKIPGGITVPKGSLVHGRILSLRTSYVGRQAGRAVGLTFTHAVAADTSVKFQATLEEIRTAMPGIKTRSSFSGALARPENESLIGSVFFVQQQVLRLPQGLRMTWRTVAPSPEDNQ
ncbi:MAG TPA: hypothetical protein VES20_19235 [Bryobacteraceae bacterium]|nr:hypothetical protein [Bryobacteraceae bacterium]